MQISTNLADIKIRDFDRQELQGQIDAFLESNSITVLETRTVPRPERAVSFNGTSYATEERRREAKDRAEKAGVIKDLAYICIEGVTLARSAHEIANIMRKQGFKIHSIAVIEIAKRIGILIA